MLQALTVVFVQDRYNICWKHLQYHTPYLTSCKSERYEGMISDFKRNLRIVRRKTGIKINYFNNVKIEIK